MFPLLIRMAGVIDQKFDAVLSTSSYCCGLRGPRSSLAVKVWYYKQLWTKMISNKLCPDISMMYFGLPFRVVFW